MIVPLPVLGTYSYPGQQHLHLCCVSRGTSPTFLALKMAKKLPKCRRRRSTFRVSATVADGDNDDVPEKTKKVPDLPTLWRRFWKVAAPYWYSEDDKNQARLRLAAVFTLTLATTGISVGFNFLGRDFYNSLANKDQEQFTKQLVYYLGAFAGGIPVSTSLLSAFFVSVLFIKGYLSSSCSAASSTSKD